jgi:hypothetical protein
MGMLLLFFFFIMIFDSVAGLLSFTDEGKLKPDVWSLQVSGGCGVSVLFLHFRFTTQTI